MSQSSVDNKPNSDPLNVADTPTSLHLMCDKNNLNNSDISLDPAVDLNDRDQFLDTVLKKLDN